MELPPHNSQNEDEGEIGEMRKGLWNIMYQGSGQHLRFICTSKLINDFWSEHRVEKLSAFRDYEEGVLLKIRKGFLRVLSIVIFIQWNGLVRFDTVFVNKGLDDNSLFFNKDQLKNMKTEIDDFLEKQYIFKPEIIEYRQEAHIQTIPAESRLPFIGESDLLGRGGYGSVSKREIAPHCLEFMSEEDVPYINQDVRPTSHCKVQC